MEMWRTPLAIVIRPFHGGRPTWSPGTVQKQAHRPPRLVHDTKVVEIPDRCEKIPLGLLEVRSRYSKGRAQAHCLL